ncbi:MAG: ATP-binding protein [Putridiphycobacter sp.]
MHKLVIKSDIKNIAEVEKLIDTVCEDYGVAEDLYGNILIAVTEGVNNAIIHGNKSNLTKEVNVTVEEKNNKTEIVFDIIDEGDGFDFANLPDPTAPENIEKPDGRGIFLMRNLSDKVEFFNGGSKVSVTFVL